MSHPTVRLLTMLELLQAHQRITGAELAERLEIDPRTVRRYIAMLQEWGIPILATRGRYGAYRLMPGFKLPPLMLTAEEAIALTLGLLAVRRTDLALYAPAVEGALAKVERVLPVALRRRVQAVQEAVLLHLAPPREAPAQEAVATLSTAVLEQRQVALRHRSAQGLETERQFDPYGLVYREGRWYVVGYCHLRAAQRVFRLDRIQQTTLQGESFTRPAQFDPLASVLRTLAVQPGTWQVRVVLRTTIEQAQQLVPAGMATLEDTAAGVEMRVSVEDLEWTARFLINLGMPFVVRDPPALRQTLRRLAAEIAAANQETGD
ncbi:MAG TPA: YafY family protein [Ktedonobacterales bacterium]|nr:YafY family protein [Ktedonobacterales bacterium]